MKSLCWTKTLFLMGTLLIAITGSGYASEAIPDEVAAALIVKLVPMEKGLMSIGGDIVIHVIGSPTLADALRKAVGKPIGKCKLSKVTDGDDLPTEKPAVLILADAAKISEAIEYTYKEKVLSVTNKPELVEKGISLGMGIGDNGKPKILLNMTASVEEELDWNPAILKIAKTIK